MSPETTLNLNANACIKEVGNFGYTHYVNICNGTVVNVPWGTMDWLGYGTITMLFVGLVLFLLALLLDMRRWR